MRLNFRRAVKADRNPAVSINNGHSEPKMNKEPARGRGYSENWIHAVVEEGRLLKSQRPKRWWRELPAVRAFWSLMVIATLAYVLPGFLVSLTPWGDGLQTPHWGLKADFLFLILQSTLAVWILLLFPVAVGVMAKRKGRGRWRWTLLALLAAFLPGGWRFIESLQWRWDGALYLGSFVVVYSILGAIGPGVGAERDPGSADANAETVLLEAESTKGAPSPVSVPSYVENDAGAEGTFLDRRSMSNPASPNRPSEPKRSPGLRLWPHGVVALLVVALLTAAVAAFILGGRVDTLATQVSLLATTTTNAPTTSTTIKRTTTTLLWRGKIAAYMRSVEGVLDSRQQLLAKDSSVPGSLAKTHAKAIEGDVSALAAKVDSLPWSPSSVRAAQDQYWDALMELRTAADVVRWNDSQANVDRYNRAWGDEYKCLQEWMREFNRSQELDLSGS